MNILILSPFNPYPPIQGGKIRIFNIIKNLSKTHGVTLAAIVDDESAEDVSGLRDYCEEVLLVERPARLWQDRFLFLTGNRPYNVVRYASDGMRSALRGLLGRRSFDLVQIEFSMMWQYADLFTGARVVLDAHNMESDIIEQLGESNRNLLRRFLYAVEKKRFRRREEKAWRECDKCFTVTDKERSVISARCGHAGKVVTVPNGVDLDRFRFQPKNVSDNRLLFIGGLEYQPNFDSAVYLLKEVFPAVRDAVANVKLDIVGRRLGSIRSVAAGAGIDFYENVPDILPHFKRADVLVVPLRLGAGSRIKILEAMAAGLPVVTTSKGCEGIDVEHGRHLMIADTPPSFAEAVQLVLKDSAIRNSLVKNARELVENKYSWEKIVEEMERHLSTLQFGPRIVAAEHYR
ncbi:MAG: glycosyltransferase family 4 protein [Candidatus Sulfobium sp.]